MIRRYHRRNPGTTGLKLAPPAEWLTAQARAVALLVLVAGAVTGVIGAFAYALMKGLNFE